jgi:hypothetical protein
MIRSILRFFTRGTGVILLFIVVGLAVATYVIQQREKAGQSSVNTGVTRDLGQVKPAPSVSESVAPQTETIERRDLNVVSPVVQQGPTPIPLLPTPTPTPAPKAKLPKLVAFFTSASPPPPVPQPTVIRRPSVWLPRGTLIPCVLVITVESSHIDTPVLGEVTQDVWARNNGESHLIIPAGTLVNCFASSGATRDRIEVRGTWVLTFKDNKEYELQGLALDRDVDPELQQYNLEDGSAGLQGELIESDQWADAKIFLGTLLSGAAEAAETSHNTVYGTQLDQTLPNVGLNAASAVINRYVERLLEGQQGDARFVRVKAGKEFYIYPTSLIEPDKRSIGALDQREQESQASPTPNRVSGNGPGPSATPSGTSVDSTVAGMEKVLQGYLQNLRQIQQQNGITPIQSPTPSNNGSQESHYHY